MLGHMACRTLQDFARPCRTLLHQICLCALFSHMHANTYHVWALVERRALGARNCV
jgi:hypothetical protein